LHIIHRNHFLDETDMKNLLNKLFKSEPQFNYILAEYQPVKTNSLEKKVKTTEYDIDAPEAHDEMEIDSLYQRN
jgi:hypothetical protein